MEHNHRLYIAMYHYVRDLSHSRYPRIKGMDTDLFEEQLNFFKKEFQIVTMEEVISGRITGTLPEKALLLTFDDGYMDHFTTVFPVLKRHHIQGSFFIPGKTFTENILLDVNKLHFTLASADIKDLVKDLFSLLDEKRKEEPLLLSNEELYRQYAVKSRFDDADTIFFKRCLQTAIPEHIRNEISSLLFEKYVGMPEDCFARELYMNRDQIRCMKEDGMFIGLHGYDHYWLGNLSAPKMRRDIDKSLEVMDEFIDPDCWVMNYPYGSYNEDVISYISQKGCALGLTTIAKAACAGDGKYALPRLDCNDFPPKSNNYVQAV